MKVVVAEEREPRGDRRVDSRVDHAAHARRVVERVESTVDLQRLDRLPPAKRLDRAVVLAVGLVRARGEYAAAVKAQLAGALWAESVRRERLEHAIDLVARERGEGVVDGEQRHALALRAVARQLALERAER